MFNRTTSRKIFAPSGLEALRAGKPRLRQRTDQPLAEPRRKEKYFSSFSELGVLCVFARGILCPIPYFEFRQKISNIFGFQI
jgi:hypothetical protein